MLEHSARAACSGDAVGGLLRGLATPPCPGLDAFLRTFEKECGVGQG